MPLFPTTPIDGQIVYVNGTNYFWSGHRQTWKRVTANALSATTSTTGGGTGNGSVFYGNAFTSVFTADGTTTSFQFDGNIADQDQLVVHVDGIYQIPGINFTANTDYIVFSPAPVANTEIIVQSAIAGSTTGSGTAQVTVSSGAPSAPEDGDLWLDSDNGKLAVYLSGGWIEVSSGSITQVSGGSSGSIGTDGTIDAAPSGTTVGTSWTMLDTWAAATYRTAKYIISVNGTSNYQATEALVIHNGVDSYLTTYAIIYTGANALMSFSSNVVSGNVVLWGTGVTSGNLVRLQKTYIRI